VPSPAGEGASTRRPWWREVPTLVAVLALLVTLLFNTFAACGQLEQAEKDAEQATLEAERADESRLYTQIGVLTQLARDARASQLVIDRSPLPRLLCKRGYHGSDPSVAAEAALREALGVYDHMAWLFNDGYLPADEALSIWQPRMLGAAQMARRLTSASEVNVAFPQLAEFYRGATKKEVPPLPCPQAPPGQR
jgi:hypothetical protein